MCAPCFRTNVALPEIDRMLLTHGVVLRDLYIKLLSLLRPPPAPLAKELGVHTRPAQP